MFRPFPDPLRPPFHAQRSRRHKHGPSADVAAGRPAFASSPPFSAASGSFPAAQAAVARASLTPRDVFTSVPADAGSIARDSAAQARVPDLNACSMGYIGCITQLPNPELASSPAGKLKDSGPAARRRAMDLARSRC